MEGSRGDGRNSKPLYYNTHYCEILLDVYLHARSFVFLFPHELHSKKSEALCQTGLEIGSAISGDELIASHNGRPRDAPLMQCSRLPPIDIGVVASCCPISLACIRFFFICKLCYPFRCLWGFPLLQSFFFLPGGRLGTFCI